MQYIEGRPLDDVLTELRRLRVEADRGVPSDEQDTSRTEVARGDGLSAGPPLRGWPAPSGRGHFIT
jgi:hypothetical protein